MSKMQNSLRCVVVLSIAILGGIALADQPGLLTVQDAIKAAKMNRKEVIAAQFQLEASLASRSALSAYPATTLALGTSTRPDLQQGEDLLVTQPIDLFGKYRSNRRQGDADVKTAQAKLRQTLLDLQDQVITAYSKAAAAWSLYQLGYKQLDIAKSLYAAAVKRVDAGSLSPSQELRAKLALAAVQASQTTRLTSFQSSMAVLEGAMGGSVPVGTLSLPTLSPPNVALGQRPDIQTSQAAVEAARAARMASQFASLPDFEVQLRRSFWSLPEQYGIHFQMTWSFWDHGAAAMRRKSATMALNSSQAQVQDLTEIAKSEVQAAQKDYSGAEASVKEYASLLQSADQLLAQTQKAFELGGATLLDVLDAQTTLMQIQENEINAKLASALAASNYYKASGYLMEVK